MIVNHLYLEIAVKKEAVELLKTKIYQTCININLKDYLDMSHYLKKKPSEEQLEYLEF